MNVRKVVVVLLGPNKIVERDFPYEGVDQGMKIKFRKTRVLRVVPCGNIDGDSPKGCEKSGDQESSLVPFAKKFVSNGLE